MGSSNETTLTFSGAPDAALAESERALAAIGAKVTSTDPGAGTLTAAKGESFVSRGETITLRIERLGDSCAIHLRSESSDDIDWGKNAGNIAQFEQALTGGSSPAAPSSPNPSFGSIFPSTYPLPPAPLSPLTVAMPGSQPERASSGPGMAAPASSIFGPSAFESAFASPTPVSPDVPPLALGGAPTSETEAPPSPAPDGTDAALSEPSTAEAGALRAMAASGETVGRLLLPLGEAVRTEAQSLLSKLEARRASLEASAPPAETATRPSLYQHQDQSWQRGERAGTPPVREPEPETTVAEGRFFCSVDGEFGPVEPCARCGLFLCARHRRRSNQSALFTNALYVCESCYQIEVAEESGSNLNVRSAAIANSFPSIQRTADGWRMEAGGKPANLWAALGTAVSLLLVVLFFTALSRSLGGFLFFLTLAVVGGYIWAFNVHWWTDSYLVAATPGRRRAVWLLAAPGLFIAGATLRLTQLAYRAAGARKRAASLDVRREQILNAAEDAWNQALNG